MNMGDFARRKAEESDPAAAMSPISTQERRYTTMDINDMDYYEYEESKKRFTPKKIIRFIFKLIAAIIIVGTFVLILGRSALMKVPKAYTGFTWTDTAVKAYESGELDVLLHTPYESYDDDGAFNISNVAVSRATGEVQLTVRYNSRSTINELMNRYALTERPSGEVFVYILSDDAGNTYTDYVFAAASRPLYEFRRVIFTGVDLSGIYLTEEEQAYVKAHAADETAELPEPETTTLYLDIYYGEDVSDDPLMSYSYVLYDYDYGSDMPEYTEVGETELNFNKAPVYVSKLSEVEEQ